MKRTPVVLCGLALLLATGLAGPQRAEADGTAQAIAVRDAAQAFVDGVNAADAAAVEQAVTPALWSRMQPAFAASPAAGDLGQCSILQVGQTINSTIYSTAHVVIRQPDGVEDVARLTLKNEGGEWRVSGGPVAVTRGNPLAQ